MDNNKNNMSPIKGSFVKPADLFKMRRRVSNGAFNGLSNGTLEQLPKQTEQSQQIEQSPLKCLNNLTDPSPTKKLPTLLKNPFNPKPVKRRLNLGLSPRKTLRGSPNKRTRTLEIDEDANLEPPPSKMLFGSPSKRRNQRKVCTPNDWTLRTRMRVNFDRRCKNWSNCSTSIHKRFLGAIDESPSKLNDNTISIEAIKNVTTVYQHPYLAWLPLFPRVEIEEKNPPKGITKNSQITDHYKMMHKDWCESLDDLCNLLIAGRCPYFYVCSNTSNILFKQVPSSNPRRPLVQAFISKFPYGMGCEFNKIGLEYSIPEIARNNSSTNLSTIDSSQASFCSSQTGSIINLDGGSSQGLPRQTSNSKITMSIDSGNASDLDRGNEDNDNNNFGEDENEDVSQFLEDLGCFSCTSVKQDFPLQFQVSRKGFVESDSNTQTRLTSYKPLALIEGTENILKLVKFLQTSRLYTISNVGKFACIPPTLLSPREFRLSTRQYPKVILSESMIETASADGPRKRTATNGTNSTLIPKKTDQLQTNQHNAVENGSIGPTFLELVGIILPSVHKELHKLLTTSDNFNHTCSSTGLELSIPFGGIQFSQ